jgi:hypothetical protein
LCCFLPLIHQYNLPFILFFFHTDCILCSLPSSLFCVLIPLPCSPRMSSNLSPHSLSLSFLFILLLLTFLTVSSLSTCPITLLFAYPSHLIYSLLSSVIQIDSTGANCPEFINAMKFSSIWRLITGEKGNLFKEMQMYKRYRTTYYPLPSSSPSYCLSSGYPLLFSLLSLFFSSKTFPLLFSPLLYSRLFFTSHIVITFPHLFSNIFPLFPPSIIFPLLRFDVSNRGALSEMDFLDGWALIFSEPGGDVYLKNFQVMAAAGFKKA